MEFAAGQLRAVASAGLGKLLPFFAIGHSQLRVSRSGWRAVHALLGHPQLSLQRHHSLWLRLGQAMLLRLSGLSQLLRPMFPQNVERIVLAGPIGSNSPIAT